MARMDVKGKAEQFIKRLISKGYRSAFVEALIEHFEENSNMILDIKALTSYRYFKAAAKRSLR